MTHINKSAQTRFVVRLATTAAELKTLFQIRYQVMRDEFPMYVPENTSRIDIDQWDIQSHHLGLWKLSHGREEAIGYMRVIQTDSLPVGESLHKILNACPNLENQCKRTSVNPIRFLDIFNESTVAKTQYDRFPSGKVMEGSRLAVKKEYRDMNPGRFLVETSFALFYHENLFHHGFIEAREKHFAAYYRYGFQKVASKYVAQDGCNHVLCYAHLSDLSTRLTEKLAAMRQEYQRFGEVAFMQQMQEVH